MTTESQFLADVLAAALEEDRRRQNAILSARHRESTAREVSEYLLVALRQALPLVRAHYKTTTEGAATLLVAEAAIRHAAERGVV